MDSTEVIIAIDRALPDEKVLDDLYGILAEGSVNGKTKIELNERWVPVAISVPVDIVTKGFFKESFDNVAFGTGYRVILAIGGFKEDPQGFHEAGICFATLYYNQAAELITEDFDTDFM